MNLTKFLTVVIFILGGRVGAQDLHSHANAASVNNETNTTVGWSGLATLSSDSSDSHLGNYSIRAVSTANDGRTVVYGFPASIGQAYTIRIWAKNGPRINNNATAAFATWTGLSGWVITRITGTVWREYVFNVTATSTNPTVMLWLADNSSRRIAGNTVLIDRVTILPAGFIDTQAPTAPSNLTSSNTTTTSTNLSWTASTDNIGVVEYTIFQGGNNIGTTNGTTTFNVTGLTQNTSYAFTVSARDAAGNVSQVSNVANVTTDTTSDTEAPSAPSNLTASGTTTTSTNLSWTASTDNVGVVGYTVMQDGSSIGTTEGNTTYNVTGLTPSTSYAFSVTAKDAAGNTSLSSNTFQVNTGEGLIDYTSQNSNIVSVDWTGRDLFAHRNLGVGTIDTQGYRLAVAGAIVAEEVNVKLQINWPDFVFEKDYNLPSLKEVEKHILEKGYLPNLPSALDVKNDGIDVGKMNAKLLQKIEELTLYAIAQEKKIELLEHENKRISLMIEEKLKIIEQSIQEKH